MKVFNYMILITGMMFLLAVAGFHIGAMSTVLDLVGLSTSGVTISWSEIFNKIFSDGAITGILMGIGAGIVVGLFMQGRLENFMILPFITGFLVFFVGALVGLMNETLTQYGSFIGLLVIAILAPLTVGFIISLIEFFRGTD